MKKDYHNEINDLQAIAAGESQGITSHRSAISTELGDFVAKSIPEAKRKGIDVIYVISSIISILDLLQIKGKWRRYFKIGKIIVDTVMNMRGSRATHIVSNVGKYFQVFEFVDSKTFARLGHDSAGLMDERIINIANYIRETTGRAVIVNTWNWGGRLSQRGFRPRWSRTGTKRSMHRKGKALDFNVAGWTTERVHEFIRSHEAQLYKMGLRRVEKAEFTPTWTHIDLKETGKPQIYFFRP